MNQCAVPEHGVHEVHIPVHIDCYTQGQSPTAADKAAGVSPMHVVYGGCFQS